MDDSDQDFVDLCSKLLKRNRKKPADQRQPKKSAEQHTSQTTAGERKRKKNKRDNNSGSQYTAAVSGAQSGVTGGASGDAGLAVSAESGRSAKEKVFHRMQQFKKDSPRKMVFSDISQPADQEDHCESQQGKPEPHKRELHPEPLDRDEALALRLQRELDKSHKRELHPELLDRDEALALRLQHELDREARPVDLEDEGLFFCQLCNKDLSHMTPDGRTQHINRCLDEKEVHIAPTQLPGVPECPICGKRFKSLKNRSTHLKRCSSDMGVPPAVLLQALQRQAEETHSIPSINQIPQTGGNKRKGSSSKSNLPLSKKPKKKPEALDEDTVVAIALSTSLLEQEREKQNKTEARREIITETIASNTSRSPALKWRPLTGKGRGKKRKGVMSRSPPLLLVQDTEAAQTRLQERVSALLLRSRAPSPPTPTRPPSSLPGWSGAAPLWQKSALLTDRVCCVTDFYTPELSEFIVPWESTTTLVSSSVGNDNHNSTEHPLRVGTPVSTSRASIPPSSTHTQCSSPAASTPGAGQLLVSSQALRDLMELAEDGMVTDNAGQATNLHSSGFVPEEAEELNDHGMSGFVPETLDVCAEDTHKQQSRRTMHQGEDEEGKRQSVSLSRLASDLGSMVNNPQLSDVQLQVDSGEVYFAHSFMVYARCPLLAEMIHESGFGVQEEGVPAAQRVLLSDVPGHAVFALLQYLYTAHCSFPSSLQPHVLELASRFDLEDLQEFCQLQEEPLLQREDTDQEQHPNNQTDQAFVELLRSMWNDEDDNEEADTDIGLDNGKELDDQSDDLRLGDREIHEEQVNEDELVEIYEFAATQKQRNKEEEEEDSVEKEIQFKDQEKPDVFPKPTGEDDQQMDISLDRSYSRLFSESWGVYEEKNLSVLPSDTENKQASRSQRHPSNLLSSELSDRTLLQSSPSVVDKLSPSPPPYAPNMPVPGLSPGLSPGQVDYSVGEEEIVEFLKVSADSRNVLRKGSQAICVSIPPHSSPKNKEPELVVLSDSSEDMNVLSSRSPSPQNVQSFTNIKVPLVPKSNDLNVETNDALAASSTHPAGSDCELSPVDYSPEVSWLIPSTPVPSGKSVHTRSSQTKSSICRTRLFPGGDTSTHSPLQTNQSPIKGSVHTDPTVASVSRFLPSMSSSDKSDKRTSFDLTKDIKLDSSEFAVPRSPAKYSQLSHSTQARSCLNSSKQDPPLYVPAYSSTPVHREHPQPPTHPAAPPLSSEKVISTQRQTQETSGPSPEVQSFHLSLSERSSKTSSIKSTFSEESCRDNNMENEQESWERNEPHKDTSQAEGGECSFQQSFMDDPPIAFNDSWGLDASAENPVCFSLKLENSGGSVQQDYSLEKRKTTAYSPVAHGEQCAAVTYTFPSPNRQPPSSTRAHLISSLTPSPPVAKSRTPQQLDNSLLDSKIWDSWDEEEEEKDVAPLSERVKPSVHKTPISNFKKRQTLVPITPLPHYSDMDTPELKNKLNKFGVRPLPKRQMIVKLKEIHQYTHQLVSSDSEDEAPSTSCSTQTKPPATSSLALSSRLVSCAQTARFKQPTAQAAVSPIKQSQDNEPEALSASQGSNTSSTAASEESERSNPEIVQLSDGDSDSDGTISASQSATRLQDRLQAVRAFILSDSALYSQILQYQPLVLSQLQHKLKAAGIRFGVSKLVDYLDSQCITFTTAKPGQSAPSRRRVKKTNQAAKANGLT